MANRIDSVASRDSLKPRRESYWQRVRKGCFVGYRKMTASWHGTWMARARDEDNGTKQLFKALGEFADLPDHSFDAATKAALSWFDHLQRGGTTVAATVADACTRYIRHLRATKTERAANDAETRFKNCVLTNAKLAATELQKLTPAQLEVWRKSLRDLPTRSGGNRGKQRSDSTLNCDMTCFRAALNLAYLDGLLTTDYAWRNKLRPIKNADQRRELYLDRAQQLKFIENAPADLAAFLRALCQLPLRPGALATLQADDFDKRLRVLKVGQDKSGKARWDNGRTGCHVNRSAQRRSRCASPPGAAAAAQPTHTHGQRRLCGRRDTNGAAGERLARRASRWSLAAWRPSCCGHLGAPVPSTLATPSVTSSAAKPLTSSATRARGFDRFEYFERNCKVRPHKDRS